MPVVLSDEAQEDLDRIWESLAQLSELAATNVTLELLLACLSLNELPGRHPIEPLARRRGVRRFVVGRHLIFYVVDGGAVEVVRVLPAEMDLGEVLPTL